MKKKILAMLLTVTMVASIFAISSTSFAYFGEVEEKQDSFSGNYWGNGGFENETASADGEKNTISWMREGYNQFQVIEDADGAIEGSKYIVGVKAQDVRISLPELKAGDHFIVSFYSKVTDDSAEGGVWSKIKRDKRGDEESDPTVVNFDGGNIYTHDDYKTKWHLVEYYGVVGEEEDLENGILGPGSDYYFAGGCMFADNCGLYMDGFTFLKGEVLVDTDFSEFDEGTIPEFFTTIEGSASSDVSKGMGVMSDNGNKVFAGANWNKVYLADKLQDGARYLVSYDTDIYEETYFKADDGSVRVKKSDIPAGEEDNYLPAFDAMQTSIRGTCESSTGWGVTWESISVGIAKPSYDAEKDTWGLAFDGLTSGVWSNIDKGTPVSYDDSFVYNAPEFDAKTPQNIIDDTGKIRIEFGAYYGNEDRFDVSFFIDNLKIVAFGHKDVVVPEETIAPVEPTPNTTPEGHPAPTPAVTAGTTAAPTASVTATPIVTPPAPKKVKIKFKKKNVKIKKGKKVTLKITLKNAKKAKFSVNKKGKKVVKLMKKKAKSVVVKGKKKGKAIITAKARGKKATCKVTVKK